MKSSTTDGWMAVESSWSSVCLRRLALVVVLAAVGGWAFPKASLAQDAELCAGEWCGGPPPFQLPHGVQLLQNIVYASPQGHQLTLDLFLPGDASRAPYPVILYLHGGGWMAGDKYHFYRQAAYMATRGFAGACIEYRLSGEAKFPAAMDDAKAAVRWLREFGSGYGLDPMNIGAAGGSAGGHLAAMLGTTGRFGSLTDTTASFDSSSRVAAVAAFNAALDLMRIRDDAPELFIGIPVAEDPSLWKFASPTSHVSAEAAPFLFLHGTADDLTPYEHAVEMMDLLERNGVHAEIFTAEGASHAFFNTPPWYAPSLLAMENFFHRTLRSPGAPAGGDPNERELDALLHRPGLTGQSGQHLTSWSTLLEPQQKRRNVMPRTNLARRPRSGRFAGWPLDILAEAEDVLRAAVTTSATSSRRRIACSQAAPA